MAIREIWELCQSHDVYVRAFLHFFFYFILLWAPIVRHRTRSEWEAWRRKYPNRELLLKPIGRIRLPCSLFYYITYSSFAPLVPSFAADFLLMPGQSGQSYVGPVPLTDQAIISAPQTCRISYLHGLWTSRVEQVAVIRSRSSTDSYCISIIDTRLPFTAQMTCSGHFAGQLILALHCFSHIPRLY